MKYVPLRIPAIESNDADKSRTARTSDCHNWKHSGTSYSHPDSKSNRSNARSKIILSINDHQTQATWQVRVLESQEYPVLQLQAPAPLVPLVLRMVPQLNLQLKLLAFQVVPWRHLHVLTVAATPKLFGAFTQLILHSS